MKLDVSVFVISWCCDDVMSWCGGVVGLKGPLDTLQAGFRMGSDSDSDGMRARTPSHGYRSMLKRRTPPHQTIQETAPKKKCQCETPTRSMGTCRTKKAAGCPPAFECASVVQSLDCRFP